MKTALLVLGLVAVTGCSNVFGPEVRHVTGTVRYNNFEGGFYSIRGDDSVSYTPTNKLPDCYLKDGLRVDVELKIQKDVATFTGGVPVTVEKILAPNLACFA